MPKITLTISDAQRYALSLVSDPHQWALNAVTERARRATDELKTSPEWIQAAIAAGSTDDETILLKAQELGLFKTAAERLEAFEAEMAALAAERAAANSSDAHENK